MRERVGEIYLKYRSGGRKKKENENFRELKRARRGRDERSGGGNRGMGDERE